MPAVETIFALSSGAPPAAIAIIRISGPRAFAAVKLLAGRVPAPRRASLASLRDPADSGILDEALVLVFDGPDTATGEDLAELHLHGGRAVVRAVEGALAAIPGLRQAEAGEFTRRAFANGRIDLNEAEGLSDLLTAETEYQRRAAASMMGGAFTRAIEEWRLQLLRISALTEAELDFSDEDDVDPQNKLSITKGYREIQQEIDTILRYPPAEKLRDGLRIVLGGPPNSGKSTLLNALAARDAAIVSDIAGTTRDVIEVPVALSGIAFILTDTAGVRDGSDDVIEAIGIERARDAFAAADMILWLGEEGDGPDHPALIEIGAKADEQGVCLKKSANALTLSAKTGEGITELLNAITARAKDMLGPADSYAVNARQRALLADASLALSDAAQGEDWLIVGEQLRRARLSLDTLTGRAHTEDLLDTVFGKFCIGK
jgi:tRNA modification GTPase